jgi:O-antigen/teichoic acid export membrane protein
MLAQSRMTDTSRRVISNARLRVLGYAVGAGLHFAIIVMIARYLGTEGFGHYTFILAFVSVFQLFADLGIRHILIRDIAVNREHFATRLGLARTVLWFLSLLSLGLIVLLANVLQLTDELRQSTYLAGLAAIVTFYGLGYSAVLRAFEEMEWDILVFVLHKVIFIALIWGTVHTDLRLYGVFGAMLVANSGQYLLYWGLVRIRHGRAKLSIDLQAAWALLCDAVPLGIAEVLRRLTWQTDKLLLVALGTPVAAGLFSAGYKFIEAMQPFTTNLTLPLFPVFSRLARVSHSELLRAYARSLKFLYVLGLPLAVMLFVFSDRLVVLFFGAPYHAAAMSLKVLSPVVILLLPAAVYSYVCTALGRQRLYLGCVAVALGVNIGLDVLLIPRYSHVGAAVGTLGAEIVLFLSALLIMHRLDRTFTGLRLLWRPLLASVAVGFCCWCVADQALTLVLAGVLTGSAAYLALLLLLQTFTPPERLLLRDVLWFRLKSIT